MIQVDKNFFQNGLVKNHQLENPMFVYSRYQRYKHNIFQETCVWLVFKKPPKTAIGFLEASIFTY